MKLPTAPALQDLQAHIPPIAPVAPGMQRPFWSIMIPTFNCAQYLRRTLQSVLAQDAGPADMQIEVVDGCSTQDDPESVVRELGSDRVVFHRLPVNRGGPNTFNACIERSRGHWIHLLHGDDMVLPGFYGAYRAMIEAHPEVVMVTGKVVTIDEDDRWMYLSPGGQTDTPLIANFAGRQAVEQQACFPAVVVKREAYERVGGFCSWFQHASDPDMWFRVGMAGPVARVPAAFALFRKHAISDTNRFAVSGENIREHYVSKLVNIARLRKSGERVDLDSEWRQKLAAYAEEWAWRLDAIGSLDGRLNQARWAWMLDPTASRLAFLARSWLKNALRLRRNGIPRATNDSRLAAPPVPESRPTPGIVE